MIPKRIHYCWFGKGEKSKLAKKCINSWKKYLYDYEFIEWNENNFDVNENAYCKEAYEAKKWAFVTDYVRLKVLYENGGIYMDTDVEVLKTLDIFLGCKAFSGFESDNSVLTGIMAAETGHPFIKKLLQYYENNHFVNDKGEIDNTTNVEIITRIALEYGLIQDGRLQTIYDFTLYPKDYFCPKDWKTGDICLTDNSVTIHHFAGSWMSNEEKKD